MASPSAAYWFLQPLRVDHDMVWDLYRSFLTNFPQLAAESSNQFLPTPISDSILRPVSKRGSGRYLAIDIGGSNLRVGFVELLGREALGGTEPSGNPRRRLERSWPIDNHLKNDNADSLFDWIGSHIAEVVQHGCDSFNLPLDQALPLGVTFSFPMEQVSLSKATLMSMGKGFAVSSDLDLGSRLVAGYDKARRDKLPPLRVAAIANDSVSTLVSFIFRFDESDQKRASMGLILGTGCNATIPMNLSRLHHTKWPQNVSVLPGETIDDVKITVNTEWSINGTAAPLRELGWICRWDRELDAANETPGFQPLEYMTAGRYLGELGRIVLVDYMTSFRRIPREFLPARLLDRHSMTTTFLSHFKPGIPDILLKRLETEFPASTGAPSFSWTEDMAMDLHYIAKLIEVRASGIVAAATIALLTLGGELPEDPSAVGPDVHELGVGYTGGCIVHFQDYLVDCQGFIDHLMAKRFGPDSPLRVVLSPCHDGGIVGAGILAAAALESETAEM